MAQSRTTHREITSSMAHEGTTTSLKYKQLDRWLEDDHVLVHLNLASPGVQVPEHFQGKDTLTLKLSRRFRGSMELTHEQITAELLFGTTYHSCVLPLDSIWGATSAGGENRLWAESLPPALLAKAQAASRKLDAEQAPQPLSAAQEAEPGPVQLSLASSSEGREQIGRKDDVEEEDKAEEKESGPEHEPPPSDRPRLRRIK